MQAEVLTLPDEGLELMRSQRVIEIVEIRVNNRRRVLRTEDIQSSRRGARTETVIRILEGASRVRRLDWTNRMRTTAVPEPSTVGGSGRRQGRTSPSSQWRRCGGIRANGGDVSRVDNG